MHVFHISLLLLDYPKGCVIIWVHEKQCPCGAPAILAKTPPYDDYDNSDDDVDDNLLNLFLLLPPAGVFLYPLLGFCFGSSPPLIR